MSFRRCARLHPGRKCRRSRTPIVRTGSLPCGATCAAGGTARTSSALALVHKLCDFHRPATILAVNDAGTAFCVLLEVHAVKLRVLVDDPRPSINADNRNDSVIFVRECVNFLCPRRQPVLIGNDQSAAICASDTWPLNAVAFSVWTNSSPPISMPSDVASFVACAKTMLLMIHPKPNRRKKGLLQSAVHQSNRSALPPASGSNSSMSPHPF